MVEWNNVFDNFGVKKVSNNDKNKDAYLPNKKQRAAIEAAGILPAQRPEFDVTVLFDDSVQSVKTSYYKAERSPTAERKPELRMGRGFISSSWLSKGDYVVIGNVDSQIYAVNLKSAPASEDAAKQEVAKRADNKTVFERAKKATGKPAKRTVQRDDFVRNYYVVAAAVLRSNGKCEMPGCTCALFVKEDGTPYLEVHHVEPLGDDGTIRCQMWPLCVPVATANCIQVGID